MKWGGWWYLPTDIPHEERPRVVEALIAGLKADAKKAHPMTRAGKPIVRFPSAPPWESIPDGMIVVAVSVPLIGVLR